MDPTTPPRRRGRSAKDGRELGKQVPQSVSSAIDDLLGPLPLLEGEDRVAYLGLLEEVRRQVAPNDVIEQIYVRDIVDLTWELMRARRLKVGLLHKGQVAAIKRLLPSYNRGGPGGFVGQLRNAKPSVTGATTAALGFSESLKALEKFGITLDEVNAHAYAIEREAITRLDQTMMQIEARRNFALREIEKRQEAFARRLNESVRQVEADFKVVSEEGSSSTVAEP
jgi:hypothetical protein